jgi:hypothetical protein
MEYDEKWQGKKPLSQITGKVRKKLQKQQKYMVFHCGNTEALLKC